VLVRIEFHPAYMVAGPRGTSGEPGEGRSFLHANLWISVKIEEWGLLRDGHIHMTCAIDEARAGKRWQRVNLSRQPLEVCKAGPSLPGDAVNLLRSELGALEILLFRQRELSVASEIGETRAAFQRRLLGYLRPLIQQRIGAPKVGSTGVRGQGDGHAELATALSELVAGIEQKVVPVTTNAVERVQLGLLLVPQGITLVEDGIGDRMIGGEPRQERRP
jgi:hypothetical protein